MSAGQWWWHLFLNHIRCAWFWPNKSFLVSLHKKLFPKVITIFQEGKCICQSRLKIMSFEQRSLSRTVTLVNGFIKHRAYHRMWHIFCIWQIRNNIIQHNVRDFLVFSDKHSLQSYFSRYFSMIYCTVKLTIKNCHSDATLLMLKLQAFGIRCLK